MRFLKFVLSFCFVFGLLNFAKAEEPKKLKVVATFSIIGDLVNNVAGDNVDVNVLVGPNGDAHTFEPTPEETIILSRADVIFEIGLGFEPWLDKLYDSSHSKAKRIKLSEGLKLNSDNGRIDPHIWHNVNNVIQMVNTISGYFVAEDTVHKNIYLQMKDAYVQQLNELQLWVTNEIRKLPQEERKLVTSHDTFGYFAKEYGFELMGAAINSATTEASDPSARNMVSLIERIRKAKVKAIFAENIKNPKLLEVIANEAHVKLAPSLYTDALGEKESAGESYIKMMEWNVKTIVENLKGSL